jgi:ferritin heavy chain
MPLCKHAFSSLVEDALNKQVQMELDASYTYMSMSSYFSRDMVALPGFAKYYKKQSTEEREHAFKFIDYINMRGGKVIYNTLAAPEHEWKSAKYALEITLKLEKDVTTSLLQLHKLAGEHQDAHLCDYLTAHFINEQTETLKSLADMITNLDRVAGDGLGLYLFDIEMGKMYA